MRTHYLIFISEAEFEFKLLEEFEFKFNYFAANTATTTLHSLLLAA